MLTATEIAAMRETQGQALPDTCTILRATSEPDGLGGHVRVWEEIGRLPCRISSRALPQEYLLEARATGKNFVMVTLPQGSDVTRTDRLLVSGRTYEVVGFDSIGEWETALRAVCEEIT